MSVESFRPSPRGVGVARSVWASGRRARPTAADGSADVPAHGLAAASGPAECREDVRWGYVLAVILLVMKLLESFLMTHNMFFIFTMAVRARTALVTQIFRKCLRISGLSNTNVRCRVSTSRCLLQSCLLLCSLTQWLPM